VKQNWKSATLELRGSSRRVVVIQSTQTPGKPWESVAEFAAYCVQSRSLDLMPWQRAPLFYANQLDIALREPFGDTRGTREAAELLKKLLTLGLSRFEPFPLQAIERVEAEAKRRPAK
jgi:hypothetical protein